MKEWLDCCINVCSSYKYGSAIGLEIERFSRESKIICIKIRISLFIKGESEICPIFEIAIIVLSLKFISLFEAAAFSITNLFFPPSRFSLFSSDRSLCCLPHFAPTASRKKKRAAKKYSFRFERNVKH